jgi:hypothetical protein
MPEVVCDNRHRMTIKNLKRLMTTERDILKELGDQFTEEEILSSVNRLTRQGILGVSKEGIRLLQPVVSAPGIED